MSINLIDNITFEGDDIESFEAMLKTILQIGFHAPNNTALESQNIYIQRPINSEMKKYKRNYNDNYSSELVCTLKTYISSSYGTNYEKNGIERHTMRSIPNPNIDPNKGWSMKQNIWTLESYSKVINRVMNLMRPEDEPCTQVPGYMQYGDGSYGHGYALYYGYHGMDIVKKWIYYSK